MYVYTLVALAVPTIFFSATIISTKILPTLLYAVTPGMLWPDESENMKYILRADNLIVSQLLHTCVLLTFGITSPSLATAIGLVVVSELYFNELFLGRYILHLQKLQGSSPLDAQSLTKLEAACKDVWRFPKYCIWMVTIVSACFFGITSFDISSDEVGINIAVGIAFIALVYIVLLWILAKKRYLENALSKAIVKHILPQVTFAVRGGNEDGGEGDISMPPQSQPQPTPLELGTSHTAAGDINGTECPASGEKTIEFTSESTTNPVLDTSHL